MQVNHGKVTEQLEEADFVLFSHQTPGVEELLKTEESRVNRHLISTGFTGVVV
jgi:hypothetical protein